MSESTVQARHTSKMHPPEMESSAFSAIRWVGVIVLLIGLGMAGKVVLTAWDLLDDQKIVIGLAEKIEASSHLNAAIVPLFLQMHEKLSMIPTNFPGAPPQKAPAAPAPDPAIRIAQFNPSYFAAWILTLLVLGLISRISMRAIAEGGKLALYSPAPARAQLEIHR